MEKIKDMTPCKPVALPKARKLAIPMPDMGLAAKVHRSISHADVSISPMRNTEALEAIFKAKIVVCGEGSKSNGCTDEDRNAKATVAETTKIVKIYIRQNVRYCLHFGRRTIP